MKLRAFVAVPVLVLALLCSALSTGAGWNDVAAFSAQSAVLDNDGDTLTDEIDLDDDNDGVIDSEDPEPFNPAVPGKAPTPNPTEPSNPAPTEPVTESPTVEAGSEAPLAEEVYQPVVPVVTSLPSTGTGSEGQVLLLAWVSIFLVVMVSSIAIRLRLRSIP